MIVLSPSILTADFGNLQEEVEKAVRGGCDWLHLDIMDGHFVPNITIGPMIVKALRRYAAIPFDVHLMVENPDGLLKLYADAGADIVTVHQEASGCRHLHRTIQHIKELGLKAGCAVNPGTPVELLEPVLMDLDMVLIMTVNPGFGRPILYPSTLHKIARLLRHGGEVEARPADPGGWRHKCGNLRIRDPGGSQCFGGGFRDF